MQITCTLTSAAIYCPTWTRGRFQYLSSKGTTCQKIPRKISCWLTWITHWIRGRTRKHSSIGKVSLLLLCIRINSFEQSWGRYCQIFSGRLIDPSVLRQLHYYIFWNPMVLDALLRQDIACAFCGHNTEVQWRLLVGCINCTDLKWDRIFLRVVEKASNNSTQRLRGDLTAEGANQCYNIPRPLSHLPNERTCLIKSESGFSCLINYLYLCRFMHVSYFMWPIGTLAKHCEHLPAKPCSNGGSSNAYYRSGNTRRSDLVVQFLTKLFKR